MQRLVATRKANPQPPVLIGGQLERRNNRIAIIPFGKYCKFVGPAVELFGANDSLYEIKDPAAQFYGDNNSLEAWAKSKEARVVLDCRQSS